MRCKIRPCDYASPFPVRYRAEALADFGGGHGSAGMKNLRRAEGCRSDQSGKMPEPRGESKARRIVD